MADGFKNKIAARIQQALGIAAIQAEVRQLCEQSQRICDALDELQARALRMDDELLKLFEVAERLEQDLAALNSRVELQEPWLPDSRSVHTEPEYYLAAFLYNFLPGRVLLDAGANEGEYTQVVADAGYRVFSFEPFPEAYRKLAARFAGRRNVTTFNFALGATEATLPFYVATESGKEQRGDASLYNTLRPHFVRENVTFEKQLEVPVRTLHSLISAGEVPAKIDFLKIDTEGYDLEVITGLGPIRPAVVQSEFWGKGFVFVRDEPESDRLANSEVVIETMRKFGYHWNLVIFRIEGERFVRFATNLAEAPRQAWGNLLFFREHAIFLEAFRWCQLSLPRFQGSL